ncbi:MAG: LysR family transcriptional regulator [Kiritimatiellae bacterium]|nr:LysR family transcriptional regulator [Kiritimatiellia bacterium]
MTFQQLKYADAVATYGSISEAARRCFVTQPTLTEAVRLLEEELRIAVFTRSPKGVSVTREGEEFLPVVVGVRRRRAQDHRRQMTG